MSIQNINSRHHSQNAQEPLEHISGLVERVTYHDSGSGFCVLRLKVKAKKDLVTVVGHLSMVSAGEFVQASGTWVNDKQHGAQLRAKFIKCTTPTSIEGIEKYLGSGMIKGIGPVYAEKLVKAFAEDVFDIIENSPARLQEVEGIGPMRAQKITKAWAEQKAVREIMLFLHSHGVSTVRAVRIYKNYSDQAVQIISEDPYRLARDIRGIGFISADKIAEKVGIAKDSLIRVQAGISYALATAMDDGHCGLLTNELISLTQQLLGVSQELIEQALAQALLSGEVVKELIPLLPSNPSNFNNYNHNDNTTTNTNSIVNNEIECIFLSGLAQAESNIAAAITKLKQGALPWSEINADKAIEWVQDKNSLTLSSSQKDAICLALSSKVTIITGGPGVGKTTLVNSILKILKAKNLNIILAAPTGRAARRMSETTGLEAQTIHRLLKVRQDEGEYFRNEQYQLDCNLLIIDEVSMVDVPLMNAVLKALPSSSALILVGDVDQLPSVGPGQVLPDLINSGAIPTIKLTEVFRQAAESKIITVAHSINKGVMPSLARANSSYNHNIYSSTDKDKIDQDKKDNDNDVDDKQSKNNQLEDFFFIETDTPENAVYKILKLITERIPNKFRFSAIQDIQVLCPMARGIVGTRNLNTELQKALNPVNEGSIQKFGNFYSKGDKVMQIENNYDKEVYNGDIGIIKSINQEEQEVVISFDNRDVTYDFGELDEIVLSYATTIHKSQGSEYPAIVIPLLMQHYNMLQTNLIYTGITRGKKLVIIVGQRKALTIAIKHKKLNSRYSNLAKKLITSQKT